MESVLLWKIGFYAIYAGIVIAITIINWLVIKVQKDNSRIEKNIEELNKKISKLSDIYHKIEELNNSVNDLNHSTTKFINVMYELKGFLDGRGSLFENITEED